MSILFADALISVFTECGSNLQVFGADIDLVNTGGLYRNYFKDFKLISPH